MPLVFRGDYRDSHLLTKNVTLKPLTYNVNMKPLTNTTYL